MLHHRDEANGGKTALARAFHKFKKAKGCKRNHSLKAPSEGLEIRGEPACWREALRGSGLEGRDSARREVTGFAPDRPKSETDGKVVSRVVRLPGPPLPPFSRRPTNNRQKLNRRASGFRDPGQVRDGGREN